MKPKLAVLVMAMSALSACAQPVERGPVKTIVVEPTIEAVAPKSEIERLLDEFALIRTYPKEQVAKEYAQAARELAQAPTATNRIRVAWLLGLTGTGFQDLNRALGLLQDTIKTETADEQGVKPLANLLHAQFNRDLRNDEAIQSLNQRLKEEQKRVDASAAKQDETVHTLTQKLKDEQKRNEDSTQSLNQLSQKFKDEQRRADLLQQKLDALTNIEKNIVDRQQQNESESKQ